MLFGFKSIVLRNVRSTSYLGFKEVKFVTSIDEVVHKFLTVLFEVSLSEHMRRRRSARLYGMEHLVWLGWHEKISKY